MPPKRDPRPTDPDQLRALFARGARSCEVRERTGLSHAAIKYWRDKLGFVGPTRDRGRREDLRRLHAEGKVDREIAAALGCTPGNVRVMRNRMGLKPHGKGERFSRLHAEHYRRRCAAAGVTSIRQMADCGIGKAARQFATRYGLPEDLPKLAVRIVVELAGGPLTANALGDRVGRAAHHYDGKWRGYKRFNHVKCPSGNYLSDLKSRGLIVRTPVKDGEALWALTPLALSLLASVRGGVA